MRRRLRSIAVLGLVSAAATAIAVRSCVPAPIPTESTPGRPVEPDTARESGTMVPAPRPDLPLPSPAAGWRDAAETVALDLHRFLLGVPAAGAFEEARADAARADLALFPPDPAELRRMLSSPEERPRTLALAAVAARGEAPDDLVRIVLRRQGTGDDLLVRLLGAEVVASLPPELLARHEEDLLRAFERETNPLVLAVALPALERMEEPRLRALLDSQLSLSSPEMVPVLVAVARDRLGAEALARVGVIVR
jgi:hypothetical protein